MAQKRILIDNIAIVQPDAGLGYGFETTYTASSTRTTSGKGHFKEMFTVESLAYKATSIKASEASKILKLVVGRKFKLYYFSPYFGQWRLDEFYVGKGSLTIGRLVDNGERISELGFNMTGINPIKK